MKQTQKRFGYKRINTPKLFENNYQYYIIMDNKYLIGDPLTKHYARLISEWLNSVNTSYLNQEIDNDQ